MRTNIYRGVLAAAIALAVSAPAYAQTILGGTVVDIEGEPVEGAEVVLLRELDGNTWENITTNANGEWAQIGLPSGTYTVTATKEGMGSNSDEITIRSGRNPPVDMILISEAAVATLVSEAALPDARASAAAGAAALAAGDNEAAILSFTEVLAQAPNCAECYYNIGLANANLRQFDDAVAAFQQSIELDPMSVDGFNGLASVYNAQRRFDLAAEASARATELAGTGGTGSDVSANAIYNQGVIFWNNNQFAEAKTQFENAIAADETYADAYYQLGMSSLNLGEIAEALAAFQGYLEVAPDGPRVAEVQGFVVQLGGVAP
jgi:Flp pilus assembly protein TadD